MPPISEPIRPNKGSGQFCRDKVIGQSTQFEFELRPSTYEHFYCSLLCSASFIYLAFHFCDSDSSTFGSHPKQVQWLGSSGSHSPPTHQPTSTLPPWIFHWKAGNTIFYFACCDAKCFLRFFYPRNEQGATSTLAGTP